MFTSFFGLSLFSVKGLNKPYLRAEAFDAFSEDVTDIIRGYDAGAPERYQFDIKSDLYIQNDTYMIPTDIFTQKTGSEILFNADEMTLTGNLRTLEMRVNDDMIFADNGDIVVLERRILRINGGVYLPLIDISETLGYSVTSTETSVTLSDLFQTKRLIVKSAQKDIDTQGAVAVAEGYDDLHIFQYDTEKQAVEACEYYEALSYVVWAEPDLIYTTQDLEEVPMTTNAVPSGYLSWGAANMNVPDYADFLSRFVGQANLREVVIAVLDTGIDSDHELFDGRIADGGKNFSSQTGTSFQDVRGHGTHVSGIIVNLSYANVKVLPIKVMNDNGEGTSTSIIQGVNYVINLKEQGVNIYAMNMSFGGTGSSAVYSSTIDNAEASGISSIVAAGNNDIDAESFAPANVPAVITVAASDSNNSRADFSNWGSTVDIAAPGVDIQSAKVGGGYINYSGTSMAAPHVAAAVALIYSNPNRNLTPEELKTLLYDAVTVLGSSTGNRYFGRGLVNLSAIIDESLSDVVFSKTTAEFSSLFNLSLSCVGATEIRYTLDGTEPDINSAEYTAQIPISVRTTVKAIAYLIENGSVTQTSNVGTMTYYPVNSVVLVTFDYNGGSGNEAKRSVDKNTAIGTLPTPNVRWGSTFIGWYTEQFGGTKIEASEIITNDKTFYAQYTTLANCYVTIHTDVGSQIIRSIKSGSALGGLLTTPTKAGYTFLGWFTAQSGGTEVTANTIIYLSLDIWAQWQDVNIYWTVTFNYNGGNGAEAERYVDKGTSIRTLPIPYERANYAFAGWFTAQLGGTAITASTIINANTTYYAHWTEKYLVTFDYNGGSGSEVSRWVNGNTAVGILPTPNARDGYAFDGWFTAQSGGTAITVSTVINASTTYYAHWTEKYLVTFNYNGGSGSDTARWVNKNTAVGILPTPDARIGYAFDGWFTAQSGGTAITENTVINASTTYYAHWTEKYLVTFDYNGGSGSEAFRWVNDNTAVGELPTPNVRDGYVFNGWFTAQSGGTAITGSTVINATATYYAHWTENIRYLVTFDYNGGSGSEAFRWVNDNTAVGGLPTPNARDGYTFNGWFTAQSGGTAITAYTVIKATATYYAHWTENIRYLVTFDYNGGSGSEAFRWVNDNAAVGGLPTPNARDGYTFNGWFTAQSGGTAITVSTVIKATATYYAHWMENIRYLVTFDYNGSSGSEAFRWVNDNTAVGGLPTPNARDEYTFNGWFTEQSGGAAITVSTVIKANATYYAHWAEKIRYLVTFDYNGGSGSELTRSVNDNTAVGGLPTTGVRDGYVFNGWWTSMSGGTQVTTATIITAKVTFYGHWTALSYTITFDSSGGSTVLPITAEYGATIMPPLIPEKPDFIFGGWYTDNGTFDNLYNFTTMPLNGINLYARWVGTFTVTPSVGDGYSVEFDGDAVTTVFEGEIIRFKIAIASEYSGANMVVKNGSTIIKAHTDGWYIIDSIDSDVNITVTGVVKPNTSDNLPPDDGLPSGDGLPSTDTLLLAASAVGGIFIVSGSVFVFIRRKKW
jgi:uncharacterized repeat protein (TIGR02543 family)